MKGSEIMAKRKFFKPARKRISGRKRSYLKSRGGYKDKFSSGMRSSLQQRLNRIAHNVVRRRVSQLKVAQRKTRFTAKDVNERLRKLKRWGRYDTWASKQLITRLDSGKLNILTKDGLIDINKIQNLNQTQMTNINKAMDQFLRSKTKSIQGINAVVRKKRQDLIEKSDNAGWVKSLTNKEVEDLYRIFDDEEFNNLSEHIKYEQIWNKVIEAKEKDFTEEDFIEELQLYTDPAVMNDEDVLDSMRSIYNKYINN